MVHVIKYGWSDIGVMANHLNMKGNFLDQYPKMCVKMANVDFMKNLSTNDKHGYHCHLSILVNVK